MPINIPASLTSCALVLVLILNIVALANNGWYTTHYKSSGVSYDTYYGLTEAESCASGNGLSACVTHSYADLVKESDEFKKDWKQTQAGGALAIVFLVINLLLTIAIFLVVTIVFVPPLAAAVPQISKNPMLSSKALFLTIAVIPLQVLAIIIWAALYAFYDDLDDANIDLSIGGGIGVLIVSIIVPIGTFVVANFMLKGQSGSTPSPS